MGGKYSLNEEIERHYSNIDTVQVYEFGKYGNGRCEFSTPMGIVLDRNDRLFVTDSNNDRIQIFTCDGYYITELKNVNLKYPNDIALGDGCIFVSCFRNSCICRFEETTNNVVKVEARLYNSRGLAMDINGDLFVAETFSNIVNVYGTEFEHIREIGRRILERPTDVKINNKLVYVADDNNDNTIHVFSKEGDVVDNFLNIKCGHFIYDTYMCFDSLNSLVVCSLYNNSIMILTREGRLLQKIYLEEKLRGIAVTESFRIICSVTESNRILVF